MLEQRHGNHPGQRGIRAGAVSSLLGSADTPSRCARALSVGLRKPGSSRVARASVSTRSLTTGARPSSLQLRVQETEIELDVVADDYRVR